MWGTLGHLAPDSSYLALWRYMHTRTVGGPCFESCFEYCWHQMYFYCFFRIYPDYRGSAWVNRLNSTCVRLSRIKKGGAGIHTVRCSYEPNRPMASAFGVADGSQGANDRRREGLVLAGAGIPVNSSQIVTR